MSDLCSSYISYKSARFMRELGEQVWTMGDAINPNLFLDFCKKSSNPQISIFHRLNDNLYVLMIPKERKLFLAHFHRAASILS